MGHMAALTREFLGQVLEHWQKVSPGIVIDCVEMDPEAQEHALLDGRIAVGILVLGDRPILELLRVQLLMEHPVTAALPKSHPQAALPEIRLPILKEQPFIGLNRMYPRTATGCRPCANDQGLLHALSGRQTGRRLPWPLSRLALASL